MFQSSDSFKSRLAKLRKKCSTLTPMAFKDGVKIISLNQKGNNEIYYLQNNQKIIYAELNFPPRVRYVNYFLQMPVELNARTEQKETIYGFLERSSKLVLKERVIKEFLEQIELLLEQQDFLLEQLEPVTSPREEFNAVLPNSQNPPNPPSRAPFGGLSWGSWACLLSVILLSILKYWFKGSTTPAKLVPISKKKAIKKDKGL